MLLAPQAFHWRTPWGESMWTHWVWEHQCVSDWGHHFLTTWLEGMTLKQKLQQLIIQSYCHWSQAASEGFIWLVYSVDASRIWVMSQSPNSLISEASLSLFLSLILSLFFFSVLMKLEVVSSLNFFLIFSFATANFPSTLFLHICTTAPPC